MKYVLSLIFGLAIAFPVPAALSSVSGENQDVIYRLLYSKAFFQGYEAQNQLRKMRLANEREEADEKELCTMRALSSICYLKAQMELDGMGEKSSLILTGESQQVAWEAYHFYLERGAPDKALFCLASPVFALPMEKAGAIPESPDGKLYATVASALLLGELEDGSRCYQNAKVAFHIARESAERGDLRSFCLVALCYRTGAGGEISEEKAAAWIGKLRKQAEAGRAEAQYYFGLTFLDPSNPECDSFKARQWLQKAAVQGYDDAKVYLRNLDVSTSPKGDALRSGEKTK